MNRRGARAVGSAVGRVRVRRILDLAATARRGSDAVDGVSAGWSMFWGPQALSSVAARAARIPRDFMDIPSQAGPDRSDLPFGLDSWDYAGPGEDLTRKEQSRVSS